jgi:phosphate:Na+ symporter
MFDYVQLSIELASGLGIFLFGMFLMEEAVRNLSGGAFHSLVRRFTRGPVKSIATGTLATAILQSSSAVTLMLLAFTGAGLITLADGIGVILGANLGTTFTAWLVAMLGFAIKMESFAIPMAGLGGLGLIFTGNRKAIHNICKMVAGLGFLFLGIGLMKTSMDGFALHFDAELLQGKSQIFFIVTGIFITIAMQSSSAGMAIALALLYSGMFSLQNALLVVIGTNIGTTVTVILGSLGGSPVKKQVALAHFVFNWATGLIVWGILAVKPAFISSLLLSRFDPITSLAVFHSAFNVFGILLFIPFLKRLAGFCISLYPDSPKQNSILEIPVDIPEAGIYALYLEVKQRHEKLGASMLTREGMPPAEDLETVEAALVGYAARLRAKSMRESEARRIQHLILAVRSTLLSAQLWQDAVQQRQGIDSGPNSREFKDRIQSVLLDFTGRAGACKSSKCWNELRQIARQEDLMLLSQFYDEVKGKPDIGSHSLTRMATFQRSAFQALLQWLRAGRELAHLEDNTAKDE